MLLDLMNFFFFFVRLVLTIILTLFQLVFPFLWKGSCFLAVCDSFICKWVDFDGTAFGAKLSCLDG